MAQYMKPKERECDCIKQKSAQFMSLPEMSLTISNVIAPITFWSISYLHEYGWSVAACKKMPQELRKPDAQPWAVRASLHNSFHLINRAQPSIQTHKQKPGNYFTCLLFVLLVYLSYFVLFTNSFIHIWVYLNIYLKSTPFSILPKSIHNRQVSCLVE